MTQSPCSGIKSELTPSNGALFRCSRTDRDRPPEVGANFGVRVAHGRAWSLMGALWSLSVGDPGVKYTIGIVGLGPLIGIHATAKGLKA